MNINELIHKYKIPRCDAWFFERKKTSMWILKHSAVEKILNIENIIIENIVCLSSDINHTRLLIYASKENKKVITIGEADLNNCQSSYMGCMAEKRGIDRAVLKLINAYEENIKSETESDEFENKEVK